MKKLVEALSVTYAAIGQEVSDAALEIVALDLSDYPETDVMESLSRCRRELRRISLADILERLPNGHPGPEEAWAILACALNDESVTVVETEQMAIAFGVALNLADSPIQARMAFIETYRREVGKARGAGRPPIWFPSLGWDASLREGPLLEAQRLGRISGPSVAALLPHRDAISEDIVGRLISKFTSDIE